MYSGEVHGANSPQKTRNVQSMNNSGLKRGVVNSTTNLNSSTSATAAAARYMRKNNQALTHTGGLFHRKAGIDSSKKVITTANVKVPPSN